MPKTLNFDQVRVLNGYLKWVKSVPLLSQILYLCNMYVVVCSIAFICGSTTTRKVMPNRIKTQFGINW